MEDVWSHKLELVVKKINNSEGAIVIGLPFIYK